MSREPRRLRSFLSPVLGVLAVLCVLFPFSCSDDDPADSDSGPDTGTDTDTGPFVCEVDPQRIYDDVAYLASEELSGRWPGTTGNEAALTWGEALFAELGLEPAGDDGTYRQGFEILEWGLLADPALTVGGVVLAAGDDFSVSGRSGSADVTAEIVFAGYGITVPAFDPAEYPGCPFTPAGYDDYAGIDATGKIVLLLRHGPDDGVSLPDDCPDDDLCDTTVCEENFHYKFRNAVRHHAAAMILVQPLAYAPGVENFAELGYSFAYDTDFAALYADRDVMAEALPDLESWMEEMDDTMAPASAATGVSATVSVPMGSATVEIHNVLGALPGTDPELSGEVVVVGGHIDHLGVNEATGEVKYGADDNASGSAATVELARLLSRCATPARTTLFALWNREELFSEGSAYYVDHPAYPLDSTIAAYSVDMVGAGDGSTLVLYGAIDSDGASNDNSWLAEVMAGSAAGMGLEWKVTPAFGWGYSDNEPFEYSHVPAVWAISGLIETHPDYHTTEDTIDGISLDTLEMSASMMYAGVKPLVEGTEGQYLEGADAGMDAGK